METFKNLFNLYLLIGMIAMLTVLPALYNIGLCKLGTDNNITIGDRIACCMPVYGWFYARNLYANHHLSFGGIASLMATIGFVLRLGTMFMKSLPDSKKVLFMAIFFLTLVVAYVLFMVDIATIILPIDSIVMWVPVKLVLIVMPPIAMAYVGAFLYNKVNYADKVKGRRH